MIGLFTTLSFFFMLYQNWVQKLGVPKEFGLSRIISIFNWQYNLLCPIISILYVYTFITNIWSWYMCWIFKLFYELVVIIIIISWGIYNTILIICNSDNFWYCQRFRLVRWILDDIIIYMTAHLFENEIWIYVFLILYINICNSCNVNAWIMF